jgi:putative glycosyltransferase (TIGR04372 family)
MKEKLKKKIEQQRRFGRAVSTFMVTTSQWHCSPYLPLRMLGKMLCFPLYFILKDEYYKFLIFSKKHHTLEPELSDGFTRFFPKSFLLRAIAGDKTATVDEYLQYLSCVSFTPDMQFEWARRFMEVGRLDLARVGFIELVNRKQHKLPLEGQLSLLRQVGAVCFMLGNNAEANHFWRMAGQLRRAMFKPTTPKNYRILGPAWFVAIGHVAMLDYYLKFQKLYRNDDVRVVVQYDINNIPSPDLFKKLSEIGIKVLVPGRLEKDYNKWASENNQPKWSSLHASEKAALIDDFWEYDFPDGEILGYAHAAARIQQEWEAAKLPSLFELSSVESNWIGEYLINLGMPSDAWFVCLHVREAGFHKQWNSLYPSMRDADILDYTQAIEEIVKAGGWVIRMGDASMKPLPEMHHVVDYAQSELKTPMADIMLVAGCKFYLGTNSGFATVAAIYGVPCLLTNWVPVGWPLWPSQDLMMPKLFKNKKTGSYLTMNEVFSRGLAFIQNWSDLPADIDIISNSPEDIAIATQEMLVEQRLSSTQLPKNSSSMMLIQAEYNRMAEEYGAFTGSRFARTFMATYSSLFPNPETASTETTRGIEPLWHAQSNDSMTVTLN